MRPFHSLAAGGADRDAARPCPPGGRLGAASAPDAGISSEQLPPTFLKFLSGSSCLQQPLPAPVLRVKVQQEERLGITFRAAQACRPSSCVTAGTARLVCSEVTGSWRTGGRVQGLTRHEAHPAAARFPHTQRGAQGAAGTRGCWGGRRSRAPIPAWPCRALFLGGPGIRRPSATTCLSRTSSSRALPREPVLWVGLQCESLSLPVGAAPALPLAREVVPKALTTSWPPPRPAPSPRAQQSCSAWADRPTEPGQGWCVQVCVLGPVPADGSLLRAGTCGHSSWARGNTHVQGKACVSACVHPSTCARGFTHVGSAPGHRGPHVRSPVCAHGLESSLNMNLGTHGFVRVRKCADLCVDVCAYMYVCVCVLGVFRYMSICKHVHAYEGRFAVWVQVSVYVCARLWLLCVHVWVCVYTCA